MCFPQTARTLQYNTATRYYPTTKHVPSYKETAAVIATAASCVVHFSSTTSRCRRLQLRSKYNFRRVFLVSIDGPTFRCVVLLQTAVVGMKG